jgi:hypothetical protein
LEKQTIPYWEKLFKSLGIYDVDYHKKYRKYLHSERYMTYITLVTDDIYEKFRAANAAKVEALVFSKPTFKIEGMING